MFQSNEIVHSQITVKGNLKKKEGNKEETNTSEGVAFTKSR